MSGYIHDEYATLPTAIREAIMELDVVLVTACIRLMREGVDDAKVRAEMSKARADATRSILDALEAP